MPTKPAHERVPRIVRLLGRYTPPDKPRLAIVVGTHPLNATRSEPDFTYTVFELERPYHQGNVRKLRVGGNLMRSADWLSLPADFLETAVSTGILGKGHVRTIRAEIKRRLKATTYAKKGIRMCHTKAPYSGNPRLSNPLGHNSITEEWRRLNGWDS